MAESMLQDAPPIVEEVANQTPNEKHAGGRPSKYKPEYCEQVIAFGAEGKSREWVCGKLGIVVRTIINWQEENEEFLHAMEIANLKAQQWWEDAGQNGMLNKSVDGSIYSRSMAARFPKTWRDKIETEHSLAPGSKPISENKIIVVPHGQFIGGIPDAAK
jgi:hypothetical protein